MIRKIRKGRIVISAIILMIVIAAIAITDYLSFTMPADEAAMTAMKSTPQVIVRETDETITFTPLADEPVTGLIYYPGGRVEPQSFAYAASKIASRGFLVIIQKMPFNLAMLGKDRGYQLTEQHEKIENWYLSGFSLGGVSACMSLSEEKAPFLGLILYASYTTKEYDLAGSGLRVLSVTGSNDGLSTVDKIEKNKEYLPPGTIFHEIDGGNHTQFAVYGNGELQKGDYEASIDRMEQQDIVVAETVKFLSED